MTEEQPRNDVSASPSESRLTFSLKQMFLVTSVVAAIAAFAAHYPVVAALPLAVAIVCGTLKVVMSMVTRAMEIGADRMGVGPQRTISLIVFGGLSGALCLLGVVQGSGFVIFAGCFIALFSVMIWLAGRDGDISKPGD